MQYHTADLQCLCMESFVYKQLSLTTWRNTKFTKMLAYENFQDDNISQKKTHLIPAFRWGLSALRHGIQISMEAILLATQRDPQNDWTATQNGVNYDVFAQAPLETSTRKSNVHSKTINAWSDWFLKKKKVSMVKVLRHNSNGKTAKQTTKKWHVLPLWCNWWHVAIMQSHTTDLKCSWSAGITLPATYRGNPNTPGRIQYQSTALNVWRRPPMMSHWPRLRHPGFFGYFWPSVWPCSC